MEYRHVRQESGTCFFTANQAERSGALLDDRIGDRGNVIRVGLAALTSPMALENRGEYVFPIL
jgi:hypothetical protein